MRLLATLVLGLVLLLPGPASSRPQGSAECRYLTTQIDFFETRLERAEQLGNELWEERLGQHLDGLEKRREARCPGYSDSEAAWQALERLVQIAARGAVTFFTLGAL